MKKLIKSVFRKIGLEITKYIPTPREDIVSLNPENGCYGNVLLSLWIKPFLLKDGDSVPNTHSHNWTSLLIAKVFLDLGYCVDVIDYRNRTFIPKKKYTFFVAFRTNFEKIAQLLNEDCIKIVHLDTAHWLFNNSASYRRGIGLQQRKGVTLKGLRIVETNMAIEYADYATIDGNQFAMSTYRYAQKPLFSIPILSCDVYPWPEDKDFESCRNHFLWFGSGGLVHKGLDLVLEAFAEMPNQHLYICGPIQQEKDFQKTYYKELYQTSNIHTIGWVDVSSPEFVDITRKCVGLIFLSCSESQSGSVITCLHAGLVPIISYESDVDVDDFGMILHDCRIEMIKMAVQEISDLPAETLRQMSRKAWEFARAHHTRERFTEVYRNIIVEIIGQTQHIE